MNSIIHRSIRRISVLLALVSIASAFPAHADYKYTVIDYPGALSTQLRGINNAGDVAGTEVDSDGVTTRGFVYDFKRAAITVLPTVPGKDGLSAMGINSAGTVVGGAGYPDPALPISDSGLILDKGAYTLFKNPGWTYTEARGINAAGLIAGYSSDGAGSTTGFIFDPARNRYTEFLPSSATIAQGINACGDVVGSVHLLADGAYPGSPDDHYGFVRHSNGAIQLFQVSGGIKTRGRGISDSGIIVGYYTDSGAVQHGFVARLAPGLGFQSLTIAPGNQLDVPGASATYPQGINDRGWISGIWLDADGASHGFVAVPLPGGKNH